MHFVEIKAHKRGEIGKNEVKSLRAKGFLPAVIYGGHDESMAVSLSFHDIDVLEKNSSTFVSSVLQLDVDGKEEKVVIKSYERHPVSGQILHLDLQRLPQDNQKIKVKVALFFLNTAIAPGVKIGGLFYIKKRFLYVMCPADNVINELEIDAAHMEKGGCINISDIKFPDHVEPIKYKDSLIAKIVGGKKKAADESSKEATQSDGSSS